MHFENADKCFNDNTAFWPKQFCSEHKTYYVFNNKTQNMFMFNTLCCLVKPRSSTHHKTTAYLVRNVLSEHY